jgi:CheY-like chemotaxis protein
MPEQVTKQKSVLVVDDDPLLCLGLEQALLDAGAGKVVTSRSAVGALNEFDGDGPDVIILDVHLADSDEGFGLAEIALQLFHPPPAILFSTGTPDRIPERLLALGRVYEKPYDPADLARHVLGLA